VADNRNSETAGVGGPVFFVKDQLLLERLAHFNRERIPERVVHAEDNDFVQAGNLYRLMTEEEKERLVDNLAGAVSRVSRDDIAERAINNFRRADDDFGKRLEAEVRALRPLCA
jgi:catalase